MIIYLMFLIVGGLLMYFAIRDLRGRLSFLKNGERSLGTVVRIAEREDDEGTLYSPVFEIPTRDRQVISYQERTASTSPRWRVGDQVTFVFEPGKPETVRFVSYWKIFWWPVCLLAAGVDMLIVGGGYFIVREWIGVT
ncbi:DUF3592 domain-containing protein [Chitinophaga lutea]